MRTCAWGRAWSCQQRGQGRTRRGAGRAGRRGSPAHGVQLACAHPGAGPEPAHSAPSPLDGGRAGLDDSRARRRLHVLSAAPRVLCASAQTSLGRGLGDLRLASRRFAPCPQRGTCETASCGCQQGKGRGRMRRICISGPVLARVTGSLTLCELLECLMLATLHASSAAPLCDKDLGAILQVCGHVERSFGALRCVCGS